MFIGGVGVCHRANNISPLLTWAQHHFRVKQTVYPSLETDYQVRTVKSHIVLITPALLPWHMIYCPGCLRDSVGLTLLATSAQVHLRFKLVHRGNLPFQNNHSRHLCSLCSTCTAEEMRICSMIPIHTEAKGKHPHHLINRKANIRYYR